MHTGACPGGRRADLAFGRAFPFVAFRRVHFCFPALLHGRDLADEPPRQVHFHTREVLFAVFATERERELCERARGDGGRTCCTRVERGIERPCRGAGAPSAVGVDAEFRLPDCIRSVRRAPRRQVGERDRRSAALRVGQHRPWAALELQRQEFERLLWLFFEPGFQLARFFVGVLCLQEQAQHAPLRRVFVFFGTRRAFRLRLVYLPLQRAARQWRRAGGRGRDHDGAAVDHRHAAFAISFDLTLNGLAFVFGGQRVLRAFRSRDFRARSRNFRAVAQPRELEARITLPHAAVACERVSDRGSPARRRDALLRERRSRDRCNRSGRVCRSRGRRAHFEFACVDDPRNPGAAHKSGREQFCSDRCALETRDALDDRFARFEFAFKEQTII